MTKIINIALLKHYNIITPTEVMKNMVQKIFGIGLGATGIVGTLIVAGILLHAFNISPNIGNLAIAGGIGIGVILGLLGIFGVAKRLIG